MKVVVNVVIVQLRIARIMLADKTYLNMLDYSSNALKALKLPGDRKTRDR